MSAFNDHYFTLASALTGVAEGFCDIKQQTYIRQETFAKFVGVGHILYIWTHSLSPLQIHTLALMHKLLCIKANIHTASAATAAYSSTDTYMTKWSRSTDSYPIALSMFFCTQSGLFTSLLRTHTSHILSPYKATLTTTVWLKTKPTQNISEAGSIKQMYLQGKTDIRTDQKCQPFD